MIKWRKYGLYFLILVYVSGAIGVVYNPEFFLPFTPFTLLYTCIIFLCYQPVKNLKFTLAFIGIAIIGFVSEVIGVKTGLIFGHYYYGNTLGTKLLAVPLTISINWALFISMGILISSYFFKNKWVIAIVSSLIVTSIDVLIEQLASSIDFWHFKNELAGIHNYIGWMVITFITTLFFQERIKKGSIPISFIILCLQLFFFGLIFIINF